MELPDDLSSCLVLNTVAAARTLLRRYDAQLKQFGVTVQQFALLAAIRFHPDEPVAVLARRVALDRTSLIRNLDLLARRGLARRVSAGAGNVRFCELTREGDGLLDRLLPEWRRAQRELRRGLSREAAGTYLRVAKQMAQE